MRCFERYPRLTVRQPISIKGRFVQLFCKCVFQKAMASPTNSALSTNSCLLVMYVCRCFVSGGGAGVMVDSNSPSLMFVCFADDS